MTTLPVEAAYRLWAPSYDCDPNPLLALEGRVLRARLALNPGMRVLDLATGTGRWLGYALSQGAHGFGVDISRDMLARAARKRARYHGDALSRRTRVNFRFPVTVRSLPSALSGLHTFKVQRRRFGKWPVSRNGLS